MLTIPPVDQHSLKSRRLTGNTLESSIDRVSHYQLARGEAEICQSDRDLLHHKTLSMLTHRVQKQR